MPRKSAEMESPIAKSYTVHMKRRTLVWFYILSMQPKRSVKVESKVGSLFNRLIQIFWFYASITFLQCNIHRNYGFIRFYHKHQGWTFSFLYIRSVASSILFYVTFYQLHMPSQDVIPHHPCSGLANEPFLKYLKTVQKTLEICPPLQTVTLINLSMRQ